MLPVICYTDASFEGGNSTPDQIAAAAAKAGATTLIVHDKNSMSAVLRFSKSCKKHNVKMMVGVELSVRLERYALSAVLHRYWGFFKQQIEETDSFDSAMAVVQSYVLTDKFATDKQWQEISSFYHESALSCSFFAENESGYKALLQLCSLRSMKKRVAITGSADLTLSADDDMDDEPADDVDDPVNKADGGKMTDHKGDFPLTLDDIRKYSASVKISIIGAGLNKESHCPFPYDISEFSQTNGQSVIFVSVDVSESAASYQWVSSWSPQVKFVPAHISRYLSADEYDDYAIKIAAHRLQSVTHPGFVFPDRRLHLRTQPTIEEQMSGWSGRDDIVADFWDSLFPINIQLGKIELPNFAMPYAEVINFAFRHEKIQPYCDQTFTSDDEALAAFDNWLKSEQDALTTISFSEYRQKKLNDFCLFKLSYEGVLSRLTQYGDKAAEMMPAYLERHQMEFDVISRMGFSGYFLIEYDFVAYARKVGVPVGDGRGSAAGSLVVYALEITDVDPIAFDLQFERFLNPERVSMPDIDADFGSSRTGNRNSVLKYISEKYQQTGSEFPSSSQIANINAYKLRSSIPKVRAAMGLSMYYDGYLRRLVKSYCQTNGVKPSEDVDWDDFLSYEPIMLKMQQEPVLVKLFKHARALTGKRSSYGVHAGGVVIAPTVITDFSAIECDASGKVFCQYDKDDIESAGLVKFDILGLRTLTLIDDATYQIKRDFGLSLDPRNFPIDDPKVMSVINELKLADIFQLESPGMRQLVMKLQPANVGEIAVLSALYRPGALESKMPEEFVEVKFGHKPASYDHPALEPVTKDTYGCIVYQEQVMSIVRALAGYSLGEADVLRRAMGKKKVEEMKKQKSLYNGRAQAYWREHYIEISKKQNASVEWDVCLLDLKDELECIGLRDCLSESGYLCDVVEVVPALSKLLRFNHDQEQLMRDRFDNISYVVREFKGHYHAGIVAAIQDRLKTHAPSKIEAVCVRVYYALSQMVRFNQVFNKVEKFAGYGFNKSHALAYSLVTYRAAWLKCYYPEQFYAAALNMRKLSTLEPTVLEMKYQLKIPLLRPDVNASQAQFDVDMTSGGVRYGLSKLKGVANSASSIVSHRESSGPFKGFYDLLVRAKSAHLDKTGVSALIRSGAVDSLLPNHMCKQLGVEPRSFALWFDARARTEAKMLEKEPLLGAHWVDIIMNSADEFDFFSAVSVFVNKKLIEKTLEKLNSHFIERFYSVFSDAIRAFEHKSEQNAEHSQNNSPMMVLDTAQVAKTLSMWRKHGVDDESMGEIDAAVQLLCEDEARRKLEWERLKAREIKTVKINQLMELLRDKNVLLHAMANAALSSFNLMPPSGTVKKTKRQPAGFALDEDTFSALCRLANENDLMPAMVRKIASMVLMSGLDNVSVAVRKIQEDLLFWALLPTFGKDFLPSGWLVDDAVATWKSLWLFVLRDASKRSPISVLEDEREVAGCYLTQTPAQMIRLAQLAEEEPAGSHLDGSPIQIHQIDAGSHDRKVSTWGTIRKVEINTVKKEDSVMFNEKIMSFYLVSDIHEVKCMISGTRAVASVSPHLVDGALVLLSGKVSFAPQYGLSLRVEAFKCFYPSADTEIRLVPRMNQRRKR